MKKRILCFGDSNTWGYNGENGTRFDEETRWTALLQKELGQDYVVIEEGLNSRTTVFEDPLSPGKKGLDYLIPMVCSQLPFDLMIMMLGTNDLKRMYHIGSMEVAEGIERLLITFRNTMQEKTGGSGKVLVLGPIDICASQSGEFVYGFDEHSAKEAKNLGKDIESLVTQMGYEFMDMSKVTPPGVTDGIHLDSDGHKAFADCLSKYIREKMGDRE